MTLWSELKTARPSLLELASKHDDVMMLVLRMLVLVLASKHDDVMMLVPRMLVLVLASKHDGDGGYDDDVDDN